MHINTQTRRPTLRNNIGGLSGPAVLPIAVRCVWQVRQAVGIPVLGMGGIHDLDSALQHILAGASLIGIGTALFGEPTFPVRLIDELERYCDDNDTSIRQLTGAVEPW
jgi:dihydroorotate dehydrogenase (NAD+) catalytic subunit